MSGGNPPVADLVASLSKLTQRSGEGRNNRPLVKCVEYQVSSQMPKVPPYRILSYNVSEHAYKDLRHKLPTFARGLFIWEGDKRQDPQIVTRGYDKFFNVGEIPETQWDSLQASTTGPYEVTVKENGCIIFASALDKSTLLVTSKHATGSNILDAGSSQPDRLSHADTGKAWLEKHISESKNTTEDFIKLLRKENVTAVFELCDDDFEEHILGYPPERRGLFLHGLNRNTAEFETAKSEKVRKVAEQFGFKCVDSLSFDNLDDVRRFTDERRANGFYDGRPVEGFVVRCRLKHSTSEVPVYFFKVKFDEPYLMFREWREVTKALLNHKEPHYIKYQHTRKYIEWVRKKMREEPVFFDEYLQSKGIIRARDQFLHESGLKWDESGGGEALAAKIEEGDTEVDEKVDPNKLARDDKPVYAPGDMKILLIPIGCPGCGKSTLGALLFELFPDIVGQLQNDDQRGKFETLVTEMFVERKVVFADRNNHLKDHRLKLVTAFRKAYSNGRIVALDWNVEQLEREEAINIAVDRVEARGENHQTLTPAKVKDIQSAISNFVDKRNSLDLRQLQDAKIEKVIDLDMRNSERENMDAVCRALGWTSPTDEEFEKALAVVKARKVAKPEKEQPEEPSTGSSAKGVKAGQKAEKKAKAAQKVAKENIKPAAEAGASVKKVKLPYYYGVKLDSQAVISLLENVFAEESTSDGASLWEELRNGIESKEFHVTLGLPRLADKMAFFASDDNAFPEGERLEIDYDSAEIPQNGKADSRIQGVLGTIDFGPDNGNADEKAVDRIRQNSVVRYYSRLFWALWGSKKGAHQIPGVRLVVDCVIWEKGNIMAIGVKRMDGPILQLRGEEGEVLGTTAVQVISANTFPHVTVGTKVGVKAVKSNSLFERDGKDSNVAKLSFDEVVLIGWIQEF
ncbi:RNA ligase-domain-containing protein [Cladochytrium replicatum]|nr:RNA ligase-domain-containing protein [Cladochytrium replicatum]